MHWRVVHSTLLVAFAMFMHAGCESAPPPCPQGYNGPYDNRDGEFFPEAPHEWLCLHKPAPVEKPPYPDLGGDKPMDPPGPKDMDAVAKAAVFVETCMGSWIDWPPNVNRRIDEFYSIVSQSTVAQAISERVQCFQDKANGCDAIRECLGVATELREIGGTVLCSADGIGRSMFSNETPTSDANTWYNLWFNCPGLGLECIDRSRYLCDLPREECPDGFAPYCTENNEPRYCGPIPFYSSEPHTMPHPSCTKVGLTCRTDAETAFCAGSGPSCAWTPKDQVSADFGEGISCEDTNTLRACVNGYEEIIDCSTVAKGFYCIDGSRPHCGADYQCNYDRSHPLPTCNGTILEICNGGVRTQIDCQSLGFETCDPIRGLCGPILPTAP